jgi:DNA processing protein
MSGPLHSGWELGLADERYPECLRESPRPPRTLRGIGHASLLRPGLGIVGSRRATPYGESCARLFAGWAAGEGVVVVSGAAVGCDLAAHTAALEAGGSTVAVLGCGADVDYPASASSVLADIRRDGAVVSELEWGALPLRFHFPERNRIIAALSAVVLVVEAGLPSGTFITADHALDAGRVVLAVPGSVFSPNSRGCNRLIQQGARPVTDVSDLAAELRSAGLTGWSGYAPADQLCASVGHGDGVVGRLRAALLADPMRPDDAARALSLDVVAVARMLSRLETEGTVTRYPDGRYGPHLTR